jgi:hypothetical protein
MMRDGTMSRKKKLAVVAIPAAALLCVAAATVLNYSMRPVVLDQGGGRAETATYRTRASIGGPVAGRANSSQYAIHVNSSSFQEGPVAYEPEQTVSLTGGGCSASPASAPGPGAGGQRAGLLAAALLALAGAVGLRIRAVRAA